MPMLIHSFGKSGNFTNKFKLDLKINLNFFKLVSALINYQTPFFIPYRHCCSLNFCVNKKKLSSSMCAITTTDVLQLK